MRAWCGLGATWIAAAGSTIQAHYFALTMDHLFSPHTRLRGISLSDFGPDRGLQERKLYVSTEDFLSAERAFTYADLYPMLGNESTAAWMTPHTAIAKGGRMVTYWDQHGASCRFHFSADAKEIVALARDPVHLLEICDVVLRLLAASTVHSLILYKGRCYGGALINAATLANLIEHCHSLKALTLSEVGLNEHHCRVLDAYSRPDLEIVLF
jgi:hypothetical protein